MMEMATGDDFPLRQGAGTGPRLVFGGYRGLPLRKSRSRFISRGFYIYRNFWHQEQVRGSMRSPQGRRERLGGRARPPPLWRPRGSFGPTLLLRGLLLVHKKSSESFSSIGLRLIFLFCETQKQGKKQKLALGSRLIS